MPGGRADAGYLRRYFCACNGIYVVDRASQVCCTYERLFVFHDVLPWLMEVYTKHVLSVDSHIIGSDEVLKASKMFSKIIAAHTSKRPVDSCTVPYGSIPLQHFQQK